jgi:poly(hydroxyalkanoate) depolymerase family esterase
MELIDWRALYASNRAVIDDHLGRRDPGAPPVHPAAGATIARRPAPARGGTAHGAPPRRRERDVVVYVPPSLDPTVAVPLVVALHGCTQTAATFSAGSLLNRAADRHGFVVAYPEQSRDDNPQGCWNWFSASHQERGAGEPARIADATRALIAERSRFTVDDRRVFVAGMSAGGAMATVMAATYPDVFVAVAVHSGLAYACARSLPAATQAMTRGGPDPEAQGLAAFAAMGAEARTMPAIVIHGTADQIVCPINGAHVTRQWMATNRLAAGGGYDAEFGRPDATVRERPAGGRPFVRRTWSDDAGRLVQAYVEVEGLGHAWSGGAPGGSYTDPRGPSATDAICAFFAAVTA